MNKAVVSVSVILPIRNEKKHIVKCLDSILSQDYPKDKLEILAVDGISEDGTRRILEDYSRIYDNFRMIDNPGKIVPKALNMGINEARGEIVIRIDAHSTYEENYIRKCVKYLSI